MCTLYGYIRVSTREQNEARQLSALRSAGVPVQNIFTDKQSGKSFERPAYKRLCRRVKKGDVLFIKSIDRLGRNYKEIQEQWRILTGRKKIDIVILDMPLLDTRRGKDLVGTFLSDIVLQILSFVAENERENIRQRQEEGITEAKKRGVMFGRPKSSLPANFEAVLRQWEAGNMTTSQAAEACRMARTTFYDRAKKFRSNKCTIPNGIAVYI